MTKTILPILIVSAVCAFCVYIVSDFIMDDVVRLFVTTGVFAVAYIVSVVFVALNRNERFRALSFLISKIKKV
jgi:molybdopterin synthase catalytic subunit